MRLRYKLCLQGTISDWRRPLYKSHLQPHGHYTHYTFDRMSIIHITPSTTWPLYNNHLCTHGHYTHVPSNRWSLYTRTLGEKEPCSTLYDQGYIFSQLFHVRYHFPVLPKNAYYEGKFTGIQYYC